MQTSLKEQIELLETFKRLLHKHRSDMANILVGAAIFGDQEVINNLSAEMGKCDHEHQLCCDMIDTLHATKLSEHVKETAQPHIKREMLIETIDDIIQSNGKRHAPGLIADMLYAQYFKPQLTPRSVVIDRERFSQDLGERMTNMEMFKGADLVDLIGEVLLKQGIRWR